MPLILSKMCSCNIKLLANFQKPLGSLSFLYPSFLSTDINKESDVELAGFDTQEDDIFEKEALIESKRNKSKLQPQHRNLLFNQLPYSKPMTPAHLTVKYNRKMFGKYGLSTGVYPGIAWPTKKGLQDLLEYEKVAYPFTIQEMIYKAEEDIKLKNSIIEERQKKISLQLLKLNQWKIDLENKTAKKLAQSIAAKEKKEKLIEEVRRHFGYKVDPRDERFKEMLEQKEKAEKKKIKEARKSERQEKMLSKFKEEIDGDSKT
uniref:Large ribosomal subunit protein mL64 n=1 Tax=Clastoptera arizonana TaxID=38151 RepID=A0A1B6CS17_9HEMI